MELVLKLNKRQLKIFTDLANKLNVRHFVVDDEKEDAAIYRAMQDGDQNIVEEADLNDFENWLNEWKLPTQNSLLKTQKNTLNTKRTLETPGKL